MNAINNNEGLSQDMFKSYIESTNGESIFELSETELTILEFIRSQGAKYSLNLVLSQENPKTGEILNKFKPDEKIELDLIKFKHTPYQYTVLITA